MNDEVNAVEKLFADAAQAESLRTARRGKSGYWCYFCGSDENVVSKCGCDFGWHFGCSKLHICSACSAAHKTIADHLERLFGLPRHNRVNSRRNQAWRAFFSAVHTLAESDASGRAEALSFRLAQADDDGPREEFEGHILKSFGRARFLDYRALAAQLEKNLTVQANRSFAALLRTLDVQALAEKYDQQHKG